MPILATSEAAFRPLWRARAIAASACSLASCKSGTTVMPRTLPLASNSTSTTRPGFGGVSDFHSPSSEKRHCWPSIMSRPGPEVVSRRTLPRFVMACPLLFRCRISMSKTATRRLSEPYLSVTIHALWGLCPTFTPPPRQAWVCPHSLRIAQRPGKNRHTCFESSCDRRFGEGE